MNAEKNWKNKGITLNQSLYCAELIIHSDKYNNSVYSSSGDDYLPYDCVGLWYINDSCDGRYLYNTKLGAKLSVTFSCIIKINPKWFESYYLKDKNEIVLLHKNKTIQK